ncbi:MAG: hypothetical protein SVK54_01390, partial [candidate division WOR-3 bacterium]|nr:hypothetical protein [candidate division WOR-3 bacterium]
EGAGITEKAYVIPVSQIKKDETLIPFGWRIFDSSKNTELLIIPEYDYHNMWGDSIKNTYQGICSVEGIYNGEYVRGRAYMEFNGAEYYKTQRLKLYDEELFQSDIKLIRELLRKRIGDNSE